MIALVPMAPNRTACAIAALSLFLCLAVTLTWKDTERGAYTGDGYTNLNVMRGATNFSRLGFLAMKGIPVQQILLPENQLASEIPQELYYTHYPQGPDVVHWLLMKLRFESIVSHHIFQYGVTALGMVLSWLTLGILFSGPARLYGFAAAVFSCSFIFFADSLQSFSWFFFFIWLYLFLVFRKPNPWALFSLGLVSSWFSLDTVVPLQCLGLITLGLKLPLRRRLALFAALPLGEILGFGLHVFHNSFLLGSIGAALADFFGSYRMRAGAMSDAELNDLNLRYSLLRHGAKYVLSLQWFYTLPMVAAAIAGWSLTQNKKWPVAHRYALAATLCGAVFWQIAMKQHSMIHAFTVRHGDTFVVLGFALFSQRALASKNLFIRKIPMLLVGLLLVHSVLAVARVQATGPKAWAVNALVSSPAKPAWACVQQERLHYTSELLDAKIVVQNLLNQTGADCTTVPLNRASSVQEKLAEFILFIR